MIGIRVGDFAGENRLITLLGLQSRLGDKNPLEFEVVYPQNGTEVLKGLTRSGPLDNDQTMVDKLSFINHLGYEQRERPAAVRVGGSCCARALRLLRLAIVPRTPTIVSSHNPEVVVAAIFTFSAVIFSSSQV